mmetsp:Transcript_14539/g.40103  ORF Transcript_14539/g.40103 Transcript_14539/m.40103 type:complete len:509 (-) Transcript_14539:1099-2625(-)
MQFRSTSSNPSPSVDMSIRQRNAAETKPFLQLSGDDDGSTPSPTTTSMKSAIFVVLARLLAFLQRNRKRVCGYCLLFICMMMLIVAEFTDVYSICTDSVLGTPNFTPASTNIRMDLKPVPKPLDPAKAMLSVPFYIYEDWDWLQHGSYQGKSMLSLINDPTSLKDLGTIMQFKLCTDFWFLLAAYNHPQRTKDPNEAKIFVVPTLVNFYSRWGIQPEELCVKGHCGGRLMQYTMNQLSESPYFQKSGGKDHIMVNSYNYYWKRLPWMYRFAMPWKNLFSRVNMIGFDGRKDNHRNRENFPDHKFGSRCQPTEEKLHDFAMIASLHPEKRRFLDRRNLCKWMGQPSGEDTSSGNLAASSSSAYDMSICGRGKQCPALAEARYSFQVWGDTAGSQRLMDIMLSDTVPIFTRRNQYAAQADFIDWDEVSYFADISTEQRFLRDIDKILSNRDGYAAKLEKVISNKELFDWETSTAFDMFMFVLQSRIYPETISKDAKLPYSALKVPRVGSK